MKYSPDDFCWVMGRNYVYFKEEECTTSWMIQKFGTFAEIYEDPDGVYIIAHYYLEDGEENECQTVYYTNFSLKDLFTKRFGIQESANHFFPGEHRNYFLIYPNQIDFEVRPTKCLQEDFPNYQDCMEWYKAYLEFLGSEK